MKGRKMAAWDMAAKEMTAKEMTAGRMKEPGKHRQG